MRTFEIPLTPDQFTQAKEKLSQQFPDVISQQGVLEKHGVKLEYRYNGTDSLVITIDHKPLLYPEGKVEATIRSWFQDIPKGENHG